MISINSVARGDTFYYLDTEAEWKLTVCPACGAPKRTQHLHTVVKLGEVTSVNRRKRLCSLLPDKVRVDVECMFWSYRSAQEAAERRDRQEENPE